ncbi:MAG: DNA-directed RNA polymerase subunit alpha [Candidatus Hydrogenedentes bacterium]|nr:DNA-directed RNA polymerase subunit alpha [Candidatus Hydrogenedentota bacterium]
MRAKDFLIPEVVQFDPSSNNKYAKIIVEPFERGYGITVGNSLRRVLLSSLEGSAVTAIRIEGIHHEFSPIPGFKEDVTDLVLNLKRCHISLTQGESLIFSFEHKGEDILTAEELFGNQPVEVYNPDHVIAVPVRSDATLRMEVKVQRGRGYVPAEELEVGHAEIGTIYLDANFSPIIKVNFLVEDARVGQRTDYDRLILEIWTNGSITPEKALEEASALLIDHLKIFVKQERVEAKREEEEEESESEYDQRMLNLLLQKSVEQIEFPQRAINCFKRANIKTLEDLVKHTDETLAMLPNLGQNTLKQIKEVLAKYGLKLGMKERTELKKPVEFYEPGVSGEDDDLVAEKIIGMDEEDEE